MPDPIQRCLITASYGHCSQHASRTRPDPISCIQFSSILPKKALIILCKTGPDLIWMARSGFGQTDVVQKHTGVQALSGLLLANASKRIWIGSGKFTGQAHQHTSLHIHISSLLSSLRTDTAPDSLVHFSFQHLLPHLVKDEAEAFRVSGLQNGAAGRQEQLCTLRVHLLQVVLDQPCLAALVIKPQASRLVVVLNLSMKCVHLGFIRERAL